MNMENEKILCAYWLCCLLAAISHLFLFSCTGLQNWTSNQSDLSPQRAPPPIEHAQSAEKLPTWVRLVPTVRNTPQKLGRKTFSNGWPTSWCFLTIECFHMWFKCLVWTRVWLHHQSGSRLHLLLGNDFAGEFCKMECCSYLLLYFGFWTLVLFPKGQHRAATFFSNVSVL